MEPIKRNARARERKTHQASCSREPVRLRLIPIRDRQQDVPLLQCETPPPYD
jgi:hypothetical protein